MKSALYVLLAMMPPTLPAAMKTACGLCLAIQASVAAWFNRSSSCRGTVSISQASAPSRRTNALPTIPR